MNYTILTAIVFFASLLTSCEEKGISDADAKKIAEAMVETQKEELANQTKHYDINDIRSAVILNVRNCQQAVRGEQNMKQLSAGDSFTRKNLEEFFKFPSDIETPDGWIRFEPGDKIPGESENPAKNGNHLWLKVSGPGIDDYVGKYAFDRISDTTGW